MSSDRGYESMTLDANAAGGPERADAAIPDDDPTKPVGVVFVHGIGSQPQSATVREFGQPLIDWLSAWHTAQGAPGFRVSSADLSYGGDLVGPARVRLEVPGQASSALSGPTQGRAQPTTRTWVLAEACWSTRLVAPDYRRMLVWSAKILGRTVWQLRAQSALRARALAERLVGKPGPVAISDIGLFGVFVELFGTLLLTVEYVVGGLAGYLVLIVLLPLSFIPVQAVRDFVLVRLVRPFLVDNVGDFETFVEDDVQALNIRRSVERAIAHLHDVEGCASIVVVAHSQGAVVAFDALCGRGRDGFPEVSKLVTFGGALNKAFLLKPDCLRLAGSLPDHIFWLDVWAYYDPVPGGRLARRSSLPLLVHPSDALRRAMHWYADQGDGPMPRTTVNHMNVLSDHGAYWDNWEHFTGRVAQEVDRPRGYYHDSRFYNPDEKRRSQQRRLRVTTLVGWRLAAMYFFLIAAIARAVHGGGDQLQSDGRVVADLVAAFPGSQILAIPGDVLSAIGSAAHLVAAPLTQTPGGAAALDAVAGTLDPGRYVSFGFTLLALLTFAAMFAVAYVALTLVFFHRWDEGDRYRSVAIAPTYRPWIALRTVLVVLPLAVLGYLVSWP